MLGRPSCEWYIETTTWISWDTALHIHACKKEVGQDRVFDFAFRYIGMGLICVYFVDLKTGQVWRRRDGGSNFYERRHNFDKIIRWSPENADQDDFADFDQIKEGIDITTLAIDT